MKRMCILSSIIGICFFIFGVACLAAPFFLNYEDYRNDAGLLTLDQVGIFSAIIGAILYGTSMISLSIASHQGRPA